MLYFPLTHRFRKQSFFLTFFLTILLETKGNTQNDANKIVGEWLNSSKDMKVQVFEKNGLYQGKVTWFACDEGFKMSDFKDKKNPNPSMRNRPWLGMQVLENMRFKGNNIWSDGQIYDPNTGHAFDSVCRLEGDDVLSVRGFWLYEWMGKNLKFTRVKN